MESPNFLLNIRELFWIRFFVGKKKKSEVKDYQINPCRSSKIDKVMTILLWMENNLSLLYNYDNVMIFLFFKKGR